MSFAIAAPDVITVAATDLASMGSTVKAANAAAAAGTTGILDAAAAGFMGGSPEDALDTACGLYLADPTAWT